MPPSRILSLLRPSLLAALLLLVYAALVICRHDDPLALVTIGRQYAPPDLQAHAFSDEGYDGQFVYSIARDGWAAADFIDVPAYRFQRILLPALGRLLALGHESWLIWALLGVNVLALVTGTWALERLLADAGRSHWYATGYGLSLGVLGAARLTTTETLAYGLVLLALLLLARDRWVWAAVTLALAALAKEPTLIFPVVYGLRWLAGGRWRRTISFTAIVLGPFVLWQAVLLWHFGTVGIGSGGYGATRFELVPLLGLLRILWAGGPGVFAMYLLLLGPFVLLPVGWSLFQGWQHLRGHLPSSPALWLLIAHALMLLFLPFSTYREPLGVLRFIVGLQITSILFAAQIHHRRALLWSTLWALTILFVLMSDAGGAGR